MEHDQYDHVMALLNGEIQPTELLSELRRWAWETYRIAVLEAFYDVPYSGGHRLYVAVNTLARPYSLPTGKKGEEQALAFARMFCRLSEQYPGQSGWQPGEEFFVRFNNFVNEAKSEILKSVGAEILAMEEGPESRRMGLWKIVRDSKSIHFFYETDAQIEENQKNGFSDRLTQRCTDLAVSRDKFHFFTEGVNCCFSSKETLDRDHGGSFRGYFS